MQRFRRHLSYANVVATLALIVAMAGGAYAVNKTGTRDVKNNSLRSADLKNRKAVTGRDVRRNSLGGSEIRESRLQTGPLVRIDGADSGLCDLEADITVECVEATITMARAARLLVTASGGFSSSGPVPASAICAIQVDGQPRSTVLTPGEASEANTSPVATDGFASTYAPEGSLPRGRHTVELACTQVGSAEATIQDPSIAVIAVAAP